MSAQKANNVLSVLVSLGSNIDPTFNIPAAIELLSKKVERIITSSIWESPAVGSSGPNYLNSAAIFHTSLSRKAIKTTIISPIENQLGRIRTDDKYIDRTIDLDILVYGNQVVDPELWSQAHLAIPASELMPDLINANTGETLQDIADRLHKKAGIFQRSDLD